MIFATPWQSGIVFAESTVRRRLPLTVRPRASNHNSLSHIQPAIPAPADTTADMYPRSRLLVASCVRIFARRRARLSWRPALSLGVEREQLSNDAPHACVECQTRLNHSRLTTSFHPLFDCRRSSHCMPCSFSYGGTPRHLRVSSSPTGEVEHLTTYRPASWRWHPIIG